MPIWYRPIIMIFSGRPVPDWHYRYNCKHSIGRSSKFNVIGRYCICIEFFDRTSSTGRSHQTYLNGLYCVCNYTCNANPVPANY